MLDRACVSTVALVCLACGSRSELAYLGALDEGVGGNGGGGTQASSSSSSNTGGVGGFGGGGGGGSGGGAGGPGRCELDGPILEIPGTGAFGVHRPSLVRTGAGGGKATLVTAWQNTSGPQPAPSEIRRTSFDPWNEWPTDGLLGLSYLVDYDGGESVAAGRDGEDLSLLFMNELTPPAPAPGLRLMTAIDPMLPDIPPSAVVTNDTARAGFVDGDGPSHFAGFARPGTWPDMVELQLAHDGPGGPELDLTWLLGCATNGTVQGGANVEPESWILAYTTGTSFPADECATAAGQVGPADRILVVRADSSEVVGFSGTELPTSTATRIVVVPRADGAWITWSNGAPSDVRFARVGLDAELVAGDLLAPAQDAPHTFGAAALGDHLALAQHLAGESPALTLAVVAKNGEVLAGGGLDLTSSVSDPVAVLTSPDASDHRVVVAWSEATFPNRTRVARFDCAFARRAGP